MADTSKEELQSIYFELADLKARSGQLPEAADCYALALYYARRVGNQPLADLCKEQILACHPNHVAVRENNAPLFFAQLLMRYPAEECTLELRRLRRDRSSSGPTPPAPPAAAPGPKFDFAHPAPGMMSSTEAPPASIPTHPAHPSLFGLPTDVPMARTTPGPQDFIPGRSPQAPAGGSVGTLDYPGTTPETARGGLASLFGPPTQTRGWSESVSLPLAEPGRSATHPGQAATGHAGFENHHPYPSPPLSARQASPRMIEDFEAPPHPGKIEAPAATIMVARNHWSWLEPLAGAVAMAGLCAMGFFAYKLWPDLQKIDTKRVSQIVDASFHEAFVWCRAQYEKWEGEGGASTNAALDRVPASAPSVGSVSMGERSSVSSLKDRTEEANASTIPASSTQRVSSESQEKFAEIPLTDPLPEMAPLPEPRALPPIPAPAEQLPTTPLPAAPASWSAPKEGVPSSAGSAPPEPLDPLVPPSR